MGTTPRFTPADREWFKAGDAPVKREPKALPPKKRPKLTEEQQEERAAWTLLEAQMTEAQRREDARAAKAHEDHLRRLNKANMVQSDKVIVNLNLPEQEESKDRRAA